MRTSNVERRTSNVEVKTRTISSLLQSSTFDVRRSTFAFQCSFLCLLTILTYLPSMTNGFIWDDPAYVVDNPTLKSAEGLWSIWTDPTATPQYYPMVHTTFWVESQLWGTEHAAGFHVDNILLHAIAAVLLWRALELLEIPGAFLAAAIFAVHPVMVESVAWVTERKNVLSIVFYLLAFHAYWRSGLMQRPVAPDVHPGLVSNRWYLSSLVFFLLALLSKTVTCSLPAAILLIIWWKRGNLTWRDVKPLVQMLIVGLALSSLTSHLEHTRVGARGPDFAWSAMDRCLIAGHAICFYALKIVWPHPLMFMYPKWDLHAPLQWIYPMVVLVIVAMLWFARRWIGRGPVVAALFFIGTLVPALGFVNVYPMRYSFVADHFQYLASIGLITLFAVGLTRISKFTAVILLPLVWITWHQQSNYKDAKTLWENTIAQNETCWMAHINLAGAISSENKTGRPSEAALAQSERALELAPNEADTQWDMGFAMAERKQWVEAADRFRKATDCDAGCAPAWSSLSRLLWDHFDTPAAQAEAIDAAHKAIELNANQADPHFVMGCYAELRGDWAGAIREFNQTLTIDPKDYSAHSHLGNCLLQTGSTGEAAGEYMKVLEHNPRDLAALTNLGNANLIAGRTQQAVDCYQKAIAIDPNRKPATDALKRLRGK